MSRALIETTATYRLYRVTDAQGKVIGTDRESILSPGQANEDAIRKQAASALATNKTIVSGADTYLAIGAPTTAQVTAQVRALTQAAKLHAQQNNGIIRLILGALDAVD